MKRVSWGLRRAGALAATVLLAASGATFALSGCDGTQEPAEQTPAEQPAGDDAGQTDDATDVTQELVDPSDVAAATEEVRTAVGIDGYTLTIDTLAVDEAGFGRATYELTGPNVGALRGEGGALSFGGADVGLDDLQMRTATDGRPNLVCTYDEASTDDALRGTIYFDARSYEEVAGALSWQLLFHDGDTSEGSGQVTTSPVTPAKVLGARHFTDGDAATATLGPLGLALSTGVDTETGQFVDDLVALHLKDGTEVAVFDASDPSAGTSLLQSARPDGSTSYALPEGVDVMSVKSITLEGRKLSTAGEEAVSYTFTSAA